MLEVKNVSVSFGEKHVLSNFSLEIDKGITAIMGASGCGKTTLLNAVSGLVSVESGTISTDGKKISYVFSEPRLLPWYTAEKNIAIVNKALTKERLDEIISLCEIEEFRSELPSELSAGMAQRVSIARGIAFGGDILLMDEPFKALDPELKQRIMTNTVKLFKGDYIVFITHEASEAEAVADRIITVNGGPLKIISDVRI